MAVIKEKPKMGIGMVMPQVVEVFPFGHTWLYWKEEIDNFYPHCRGYYPIRDEIPPPVRNNRMKMLRFFAQESVPGHYRLDRRARRVMQECLEQIFQKEWEITKEQLERLKARCRLPEGKTYKAEGQYSWNKKRSDWNNCSSWVIKVVCYVKEEPKFLTSSSPKQLSVVKEEIKWNHVPE